MYELDQKQNAKDDDDDDDDGSTMNSEITNDTGDKDNNTNDAEFRAKTAWIVESSQQMRFLVEDEEENAAKTPLRARIRRCYPDFSVCGPDEKDWRVAADVVHQWSVAPLPFWFLDLFLLCSPEERPVTCEQLRARIAWAGDGTAAQAFWRGLLALTAAPLPEKELAAVLEKYHQEQTDQKKKRKRHETTATTTMEEGEIDEQSTTSTSSLTPPHDAADATDIITDDAALVFWRIVKACSVSRLREVFSAYWTDFAVRRFRGKTSLDHFDGLFDPACFRAVVVEPKCFLALDMAIRWFTVDKWFCMRGILDSHGWIAGLDKLYTSGTPAGKFLLAYFNASRPATFCWVLAKSTNQFEFLWSTISAGDSESRDLWTAKWLVRSISTMLKNGAFQAAAWTSFMPPQQQQQQQRDDGDLVCAPSVLLRALMYYAIYADRGFLYDFPIGVSPVLAAAARCAYDADSSSSNRAANDAFLQHCTLELLLHHWRNQRCLGWNVACDRARILSRAGLLMWPALDSETAAHMFIDFMNKTTRDDSPLLSIRNPGNNNNNNKDDDINGANAMDDDDAVVVYTSLETLDRIAMLRTFGWFQHPEQLRPLAVRLFRGVPAADNEGRTVHLSMSVDQFLAIVELRNLSIPHAVAKDANQVD